MKIKKIVYGLVGTCVLGVAIFTGINSSVFSEAKGTRIVSDAQYKNLSWDNIVNNGSDSIVIGKIKRVEGKVKAVKVEDDDYLYANQYIIEIKDKIKGAKNKQEMKIEVLEEDDPGLKNGDHIVLFATLKQNDIYVPVGGNYGIFKVENGKVLGKFIDKPKDYKEPLLQDFVADVQKTLKIQ